MRTSPCPLVERTQDSGVLAEEAVDGVSKGNIEKKSKIPHEKELTFKDHIR